MQTLKLNEIHFVSGGLSKNDMVDITSIMVGMSAGASLAHHTLRIVGYVSYTNIYTIIPIAIAEIAGAYLGYRIGQYMKG